MKKLKGWRVVSCLNRTWIVFLSCSSAWHSIKQHNVELRQTHLVRYHNDVQSNLGYLCWSLDGRKKWWRKKKVELHVHRSLLPLGWGGCCKWGDGSRVWDQRLDRQSGPGRVLLGEMMYLFVLPYSHDSGPTPEPLRLVTWDETKANVFCPRLPLHLSGGRPVLLAQGSQSHWIPSGNFIKLICRLQAAGAASILSSKPEADCWHHLFFLFFFQPAVLQV